MQGFLHCILASVPVDAFFELFLLKKKAIIQYKNDYIGKIGTCTEDYL